MKTPQFLISPQDKKLINSILKKIENEKKNSVVKIISFESLFKLLTKDEKVLVEKFLDINPLVYGFKAPYLGIQDVPENLVAIRNQKCNSGGKTYGIETQYLPKPVFKAYNKLNNEFYEDTKRKLLIGSSYRSPAYQIIIFLWYLKFNKFDFSKTVKRVAIPGYSEHGFPKKQALDFITTSCIPDDQKPLEFAKTIEYKWLLENANEFGFYESYPLNNKLGVMFEPWHWQFRR